MVLRRNNLGFTLIELLVSMAIIGILSTVGLGSFLSSQIKSRDARRKSDLGNIQKALEMYFVDHGSYPKSDSAGQIVIGSGLEWNSRAQMKDSNDTIYMQELPSDPTALPNYCYKSPGDAYQLYARLENLNDPQRLPANVSCNGIDYDYGVASSNSKP